MGTKHVYSKALNGSSDFIYVDLLPDVKRSRQFNVNVIASLFLFIFLSFVFIYMPFRTATEKFEALNAVNNDLEHELALTREEFIGYEINLDTIVFEEEIDNLATYKVDFNNFFDDVVLVIDAKGGKITYINYSASNSTMQVTVLHSSPFTFNILNNDLLELGWVETSQFSIPTRTGDAVLYSSTFSLGVDRDVK